MKGTKSDRETLRTRVKDALGERTQKELEQTLGLSGGTLSRVFGGRRNVDADFLRALADEIGVEVPRLLHGTDFLLLFDETELPRDDAQVDVVAPVPPPPTERPSSAPELPSTEPRDAERPAKKGGGRAAARKADATTEEVKLSERETEPTMPVVDLPEVSNGAPREERRQDTVTVDEPVRPGSAPRKGISGRIRRFLSSLFGG